MLLRRHNLTFASVFMGSKSEIKCPACGKWSVWEQNETDQCQHCGAILRPVSEMEKEKIRQRNEVEYIKVPIHDSDSWPVKLFKQVFNWIQFIFVAIISFFLWFFTAGPG
ncbi:MAG: hypothetical protein ACK4GL_03945 [Flavobacteriales bacterium]